MRKKCARCSTEVPVYCGACVIVLRDEVAEECAKTLRVIARERDAWADEVSRTRDRLDEARQHLDAERDGAREEDFDYEKLKTQLKRTQKTLREVAEQRDAARGSLFSATESYKMMLNAEVAARNAVQAARDEALYAIRIILEADALRPFAHERGDDDASIAELCRDLWHRHVKGNEL